MILGAQPGEGIFCLCDRLSDDACQVSAGQGHGRRVTAGLGPSAVLLDPGRRAARDEAGWGARSGEGDQGGVVGGEGAGRVGAGGVSRQGVGLAPAAAEVLGAALA